MPHYTIFLLVLASAVCSCQTDTATKAPAPPGEISANVPLPGTRKTVYEIGKPLTDCSANFENLFRNWKAPDITNANDYELQRYTFVETIGDSADYRKYRRHFAGTEAVGASVHSSTYTHADGTSETTIRKKSVFPSYRGTHHPFGGQPIPPDMRQVLTPEFIDRVVELEERDFDLDTLALMQQYAERTYETVDTLRDPLSFSGVTYAELTTTVNDFSPGPVSENYAAVVLNETKEQTDLSPAEQRELILERTLLKAIQYRMYFRDAVDIGDYVYRIDFTYLDDPFSTFVICDAQTHGVVYDPVFRIMVSD